MVTFTNPSLDARVSKPKVEFQRRNGATSGPEAVRAHTACAKLAPPNGELKQDETREEYDPRLPFVDKPQSQISITGPVGPPPPPFDVGEEVCAAALSTAFAKASQAANTTAEAAEKKKKEERQRWEEKRAILGKPFWIRVALPQRRNADPGYCKTACRLRKCPEGSSAALLQPSRSWRRSLRVWRRSSNSSSSGEVGEKGKKETFRQFSFWPGSFFPTDEKRAFLLDFRSVLGEYTRQGRHC